MGRETPYGPPLDPAEGLVRLGRIWAPDDAYPLWEVSLELANDDLPSTVGGTGFTRGEALMRAAGETVERYAWAQSETSGNETAGSAGAPDLTAVDPSGCASGLDRDAAVERGWRELIERDAYFMVLLGLTPAYIVPRRLWLQTLPEAVRDHAAWNDSGRLIRVGLVPVTDGRWASVTLVMNETPLTLGCGLGESDRASRAVADSIREAVQVSRAVSLHGNAEGSSADPDRERLRLLASVEGLRAAKEFTDRFIPLPGPPVDDLDDIDPGPLMDPRLDLSGVSPSVADLTHLLPHRIRDLGWTAVRVSSTAVQSFRWNESPPSSWSPRRLARFGIEQDDERVTFSPPHLLV